MVLEGKQKLGFNQNVSLPSNLPKNTSLLLHFFYTFDFKPHNFSQSEQNLNFFVPITKPVRWQF